MTSIEWTKITPKMKVTLEQGQYIGFTGKRNSWYEADGKLVTFGSRDQKLAQAWLDKRVKANARGTQPGIGPSWAKYEAANAKKVCKTCVFKSCSRRNKPFAGTCGYKETKK